MHDPHQEFFDQLASEWDLHFTAEDLERLSHIVEKFGVTPGMEILDLGCGTGVLFDLLRRRVGKEGTVTGVDFSIEMVLLAHRNFPFENVNVVDADAIALPFKDKIFDMALSFNAFPHFSNQKNALAEVYRVLKPGSLYHIVHLFSSKEIAVLHDEVGGAVKGDQIPAEDQMRRMFEENNFKVISIEDHTGLYLASAKKK